MVHFSSEILIFSSNYKFKQLMKRFHVSSAESWGFTGENLGFTLSMKSSYLRRPIRPTSQPFGHLGTALPQKWLYGRKAYAAIAQELSAVNAIKPQALVPLGWCTQNVFKHNQIVIERSVKMLSKQKAFLSSTVPLQAEFPGFSRLHTA